MKIIKIKKKFDYHGIQIRIVEREEPYMNCVEPLVMTRVIAPNDGLIPVKLQYKQTLKSIMANTIELLDLYTNCGQNTSELTKII